MGTPTEIDRALPALGAVLDVVDASRPFPCRPPSRLVRVYLDVRFEGGILPQGSEGGR